MSLRILFKAPLGLLAAALLCAGLVGVASAAGGTVSLKLKGEYRKHHAVACHDAKDYRLFHRRALIEFKGVVVPAPTLHFPVRLELKRCVHGHWHPVGDRHTLGKKLTGRYKGFFSARPLAPRSHRRSATSYYFARAIVSGSRSTKVFFAVTN